MPWPACVLLFSLCALAADKKPVTIQNLPPPSHPASITWAPDGKRFAYIEDQTIWQYDVPSRKKKSLLKLAALEEKAVKPAQSETETSAWQNRRVSETSFQWSPTGR